MVVYLAKFTTAPKADEPASVLITDDDGERLHYETLDPDDVPRMVLTRLGLCAFGPWEETANGYLVRVQPDWRDVFLGPVGVAVSRFQPHVAVLVGAAIEQLNPAHARNLATALTTAADEVDQLQQG